ncbi:MAG: restriction endonuclease subunit S [Spirochaetia bacterium]
MSAEMQAYPEYKVTGLWWLGEIPAHWELKVGHSAFTPKQVKNVGLLEKKVLSLSYGRIVVKPQEKLHGLVPESFETYQIVDPGDIIIRGTDLQNDKQSLRIGFSRYRGIITSAYICLKPLPTVSAEYAYQILNVYDLTKAIYAYGSGLRQNLDKSDLERIPVFLPPRDEQDAIVSYLNMVDKRINRFIRNRQRLIEVLKEQKQAITNKAVTQGLGPNVPLKPSGVDWIGDIPKDWKVLRAKYLFDEVDKRSMDGSETHLSMSQKLGLVPAGDLEEHHFHSNSYAGGKIVELGDIVLNRLKAHLGVFRLSEQCGVISPDYTVLRPKNIESAKYFELVLTSSIIRPELRCRVKGLVEGFWRLYTDDFYDIRLPVPPIHKQLNIVRQIKRETAELDAAIKTSEHEIDLIREYRTRLISDVVTGKLDVRHLAPAPKSEELEEEFNELEPLDEAAGEMGEEALTEEVSYADR